MSASDALIEAFSVYFQSVNGQAKTVFPISFHLGRSKSFISLAVGYWGFMNESQTA